jgi:hypothetical protein
MNLVGKIFTFLIFLMCIVFSTIALMVYSAHKNWRELVVAKGGYADQLTEAQKENVLLKDQKLKAENELEDEKKKTQHRLIALEQAARDAIEARRKSDDALQEKVADIAKLAATTKGLTDRINVLQTTITGMQDNIKVVVEERNKLQKDIIKTNDDLMNAVAERGRLEKLQRELAKQIIDMKIAMEGAKVRMDTLPKNGPVDLEGEVTAVVRDDVEISVGADDGVRKGFKFQVTRPSTQKYIGKIEVIRVDYPNRAVCRADKQSLLDQIQRGDHVKLDMKSR